jgi:1-phosphatidylinositol-3-phosphate 5-kinase
MSSNNPTVAPAVTGSVLSPLGLRSRRNSLASITGSSHVDKEQLAQALDAIHNTASQSETLTTFNEFASPPTASSGVESKGLAGELMQNGLSGLYSRFRGAVVGGKDKVPTPLAKDAHDKSSVKSLRDDMTTSKSSNRSVTREASTVSASPVLLSSPSSRIQSPITASFAGSSDSQLQNHKVSLPAPPVGPITKPSSSVRPAIPPPTKSGPSSTVASVNVNAFIDRGRPAEIPEPMEVENVMFRQVTFQGNQYGNHDGNLPGGAQNSTPALDSDASGSDIEHDPLGSTSNDNLRSHIHKFVDIRSDISGGDGLVETRTKLTGASIAVSSAFNALQSPGPTTSNGPKSPTTISDIRRPTAVDRITQSHLPGYLPSRASSTDRSTAEASPINTSAHNSVHHESFAVDDSRSGFFFGRRHIPGTTTNEGDPAAVSARLEQMRKQVLSLDGR